MLTYLLETTYLWIYRLNFIGANTYYHWHWQVKGLDSYLIADMRMLANRPISSSRKFRSQAILDRQKKLLPSEAIKSNFIMYTSSCIMHHLREHRFELVIGYHGSPRSRRRSPQQLSALRFSPQASSSKARLKAVVISGHWALSQVLSGLWIALPYHMDPPPPDGSSFLLT
jgi:hypothetical protein